MELKELMNKPIVFTNVDNYNEMDIEWVEEYAKKHNFEFDDVMSALHLDKDAKKDEYIFLMKLLSFNSGTIKVSDCFLIN